VRYPRRPVGPEALGIIATPGSSAKSLRIVSTLRPHVVASSAGVKCFCVSKPMPVPLESSSARMWTLVAAYHVRNFGERRASAMACR